MLLLVCSCLGIAKGQSSRITQTLHQLQTAAPGTTGQVDLLTQLAHLYLVVDIDSSFQYSIDAKQQATAIGYEKGQTRADHLIAYTLFSKGLYAESLELFAQILPRYEAWGDTANIVRLYMDKSEVLNKGIVEKTEVVDLLRQAIQIGSNLSNDSIMGRLYLTYCNRYADLPTDSARYYVGKVKEIAARYNNESLMLQTRLWDAKFLMGAGKKQEAETLINQVLAEGQRTGNVNVQINACFNLVNLYADEPRKALEYFYQSYEIARNSGNDYISNYIVTEAIKEARKLGDKDEIIKLYTELEKVTANEWERTQRFITDYVRFNDIQQDNRLLMEKSEKRALWLVVISAIAVMVVLAIYLIMLSRNRKAKQQIEALNSAADIQVIAMEEARHQAIKEEQQRLGQELHDGLSASIAAIKHRMEILAMDTADEEVKQQLAVLQAELGRAYETARNKSHEWFSAAQQEEQSFERQIKQLTDSALPDSRYRKDIHIDDHSLRHINADTRITLLRIIQEGITNIIKHARAKSVGILIYEEDRRLQLVINDDGRGLDERKLQLQTEALGIQSMKRRVQLLNGESFIRSGSEGTEITISIPLSVA